LVLNEFYITPKLVSKCGWNAAQAV
jgi:hypothetical protein